MEVHNLLSPLNTLIRAAATAGKSDFVYNLWHVPNILTCLIFCFVYGKKYNIKKGQALSLVAIVYSLGLLWILFMGWAATGFKSWGSNNIVKGFIYFPVFALIPARLFKLDKNLIWDFIAPAFPLLQFMAHLACNFAGCCYGYPMVGGIWNPRLEEYLFPIQLLESLVSLLVAIACILYARKNRFQPNGNVYPFFLILFGATRFFLEFLRNNEKVFYGISNLALHALLMVVVGSLWLLVINPTKALEREKSAAKANNLHRRKRNK